MRRFQALQPQNPLPSSSPAFGTAPPVVNDAPIRTVLPVNLPPATLRPIAFRILTKKYGLTITATALQKLATFIGRQCGNKWREGLAEGVLGYVAQRCREGGRVIVDKEGDGEFLDNILKELSGRMRGGKVTTEAEQAKADGESLPIRTGGVAGAKEDTRGVCLDPRAHMKVVHAKEQPRLVYHSTKKHFDRIPGKASLLPNPSSKTTLFRNRYNLIHQRLMRMDAFQVPTMNRAPPSLQRSGSSAVIATKTHRLTPIANLLGRSGTHHLILGMLSIAPTGTLALNDLTGSIALDLSMAIASVEKPSWFVPGMIVLVDGLYEDDEMGNLGGGGGIGGTIGGRIIGTRVGTPLAERRHITLGTQGDDEEGVISGGGFGWTDFLGLGSEKAVGDRMRDLKARIFMPPPIVPSRRQTPEPTMPDLTLASSPTAFASSDFARSSLPPQLPSPKLPPPNAPPARSTIAILGNLVLDQPSTLSALTKILSHYDSLPESDLPLAFILLGPFTTLPALTLSTTSSRDYKELFNALAAVLSTFPDILANSTFIFVPGDNDAWHSAFGRGASGVLPLDPVPGIFTSRIAKAFASANAAAAKAPGAKSDRVEGKAVWTSNPSRLSLFGPTIELVLFRDDISSRFRRHSIRTAPPPSDPETLPDINFDELSDPHQHAARKLTKTLLDQAHLSPFRLQDRPVHWDCSDALSLYPLPTAVVVCDPEGGSWVVGYEGCEVVNPGGVARSEGWGGRRTAGWCEFDVKSRKGELRELGY